VNKEGYKRKLQPNVDPIGFKGIVIRRDCSYFVFLLIFQRKLIRMKNNYLSITTKNGLRLYLGLRYPWFIWRLFQQTPKFLGHSQVIFPSSHFCPFFCSKHHFFSESFNQTHQFNQLPSLLYQLQGQVCYCGFWVLWVFCTVNPSDFLIFRVFVYFLLLLLDKRFLRR
jgi:hypothetical protein